MKVFGAHSPLDRTHTFDNFGFEYSVYATIPDLVWEPEREFTDIVDARGLELVSKDNPLLLWSGGIDSTMIMASLLKTGKAFTVGYTDWSIIEYGALFKRMQANEWPQITLMHLADKEFADLQDDYFLITGVCGDQSIGTENYYNMQRQGLKPTLAEPWRDLFHSSFVDFFEPQVSQAQTDIDDLADFLWWINFSMKYQDVQLNVGRLIGFDMTRMETFAHFFDTNAMQAWAIRNREQNKEFLWTKVETHYKKAYKDYAYDVFEDADYRDNKPKVRSITNEIRKRTPIELLDVDGKLVVRRY